MATIEFNLSGLRAIYEQAYHSSSKFLAFDVVIGKGRFFFMMFLSVFDGGDKDTLYLYLRNINVACELKTYGRHLDGCFKVYFKDDIQNLILRELQLHHGGAPFSFIRFLEDVNARIPTYLNRTELIQLLRKNRNHVPSGIIEDAEKTVLVGTVKLPDNKKPLDKTLRKLLLYVDGDEAVIIQLINNLKRLNYTLRWTTEDNRSQAVEINSLLNSL